MTKLSETQTIILTAGAQRPDNIAMHHHLGDGHLRRRTMQPLGQRHGDRKSVV